MKAIRRTQALAHRKITADLKAGRKVGQALNEMRQAAKIAHSVVRMELERQKNPEWADPDRLMRYIRDWVYILDKICAYELPKLTAVRVGGDDQNRASIPIDIKSLKDDQLYQLIDRLSGIPDMVN